MQCAIKIPRKLINSLCSIHCTAFTGDLCPPATAILSSASPPGTQPNIGACPVSAVACPVSAYTMTEKTQKEVEQFPGDDFASCLAVV